MKWPTQNIFVTGTDTGVGKSVVSAWLVQHLGAHYWKPIQSGLDGETDTHIIQKLTGLDDHHCYPPTFSLTQPLSPHEAARRDGISIHLDDFSLPPAPRPLVVEGAGGVLVPLNKKDFMVDLIRHLDLPVVLVARTALGTINHTLLSLEALRHRQIPILGIILNGPENPANTQALRDYAHCPILAAIPHLTPLNAQTLATLPSEAY
ncbi:MAG: dethiobiotin synthase [Nitrospirae bacterium]|nr:dethiobiotin synthase [Magnetococcales bacterium]HAT49051.1 dethiobiotin synthase [Alphaproteobacteria bacterium]